MLSTEHALGIVGTVSEGTLRTEDLGAALVSLLDDIGELLQHQAARIIGAPSAEEVQAYVRWNGRKDDLLGEWERESAKEDADPEALSEMLDDMERLVEEALPEGFSLHTSEGDGAYLAIWDERESVEAS